MSIQTNCMVNCSKCCLGIWKAMCTFIHDSPFLVVASLVAAIALQILASPIAGLFWAYFGFSTAVHLTVKAVGHWKIVDLSSIIRKTWNFKNNHPDFQPMVLLAGVICCSISLLAATLVGGLAGFFQGIITDTELNSKRLAINTARKKQRLS